MRFMYNTGKTSMRIAHVLITGILGTALLTQFAVADTDGERSALVRIAHELEALEPLIGEAESQANPDARIRLRYDWLRQDLLRVQQGIQEHIDVPREEPKTFPSLRGDYRR